MKRFVILSALLLFCMAGKLYADDYVYVGSWKVDDGPSWWSPSSTYTTAYTGQGAAALLFGHSASDYVISTVDNTVANINDSNWVSVYGIGNGVVADNYVVTTDGLYDSIGDTSAYVTDNALGSRYTNYAFLDLTLVDAVPDAVPEPSSFLLLGSGLLGLAEMMRRKFLAS